MLKRLNLAVNQSKYHIHLWGWRRRFLKHSTQRKQGAAGHEGFFSLEEGQPR